MCPDQKNMICYFGKWKEKYNLQAISPHLHTDTSCHPCQQDVWGPVVEKIEMASAHRKGTGGATSSWFVWDDCPFWNPSAFGSDLAEVANTGFLSHVLWWFSTFSQIDGKNKKKTYRINLTRVQIKKKSRCSKFKCFILDWIYLEWIKGGLLGLVVGVRSTECHFRFEHVLLWLWCSLQICKVTSN